MSSKVPAVVRLAKEALAENKCAPGLPRLQRRPPKNTPSSPASTDCPAHSSHGHRISCPERARFPEAAARLPEQQEAGRKDQEGWKGWQEMGEGRRSGLQDSQDRH